MLGRIHKFDLCHIAAIYKVGYTESIDMNQVSNMIKERYSFENINYCGKTGHGAKYSRRNRA